jgi:hypothetical protein
MTATIHPVPTGAGTRRAPTSAWTAAEQACAQAARRMYEGELALHTARQSGVDEWVVAAYRRLHDAIGEHSAALNMLDVLSRRSA